LFILLASPFAHQSLPPVILERIWCCARSYSSGNIGATPYILLSSQSNASVTSHPSSRPVRHNTPSRSSSLDCTLEVTQARSSNHLNILDHCQIYTPFRKPSFTIRTHLITHLSNDLCKPSQARCTPRIFYPSWRLSPSERHLSPQRPDKHPIPRHIAVLSGGPHPVSSRTCGRGDFQSLRLQQ
jgi:hypothetical protein